MIMPPPEELDAQVPYKQGSVEFQLFPSLLRFGSGWFANQSLQRTRWSVFGCSLRSLVVSHLLSASLSLVR